MKIEKKNLLSIPSFYYLQLDLEAFYFYVFQAKVNGFTSDKMKDSQTLINAEQIEMDAMEVTIDLPSKAKKRLKSKRHVYTLPSNNHNIKE